MLLSPSPLLFLWIVSSSAAVVVEFCVLVGLAEEDDDESPTMNMDAAVCLRMMLNLWVKGILFPPRLGDNLPPAYPITGMSRSTDLVLA